MKRTGWAVLLSVTLASSAWAKDVAGVQFPDTVQVEGNTLSLKGGGVRTKFIVKVYAAGLYVTDLAAPAAAVLTADAPRRVHLVMLRSVGKDKIVEAIQDGFAKNSKAQLPKLEARLKTFSDALKDTKSGDSLIFTYLPGVGLKVSGAASLTIEGKDFADALFAVWLGADPVDSGLKEGMLGGK